MAFCVQFSRVDSPDDGLIVRITRNAADANVANRFGLKTKLSMRQPMVYEVTGESRPGRNRRFLPVSACSLVDHRHHRSRR